MGGMSAQNKRGAASASRQSRRGSSPVSLITDAKRSRLEGWHHRRRLYALLQLLRLPVLAAAGVSMWLTHNVALSVIIAVISLPLPWVAVLLANESGEVDKQERKVYKPAVVRANRQALNASRGVSSGSRPHRALETGGGRAGGIESAEKLPHDGREIITVEDDD